MKEDRRLKVLFVTQEDPFYGRHFFAEFFRSYDPAKFNILGVVVQKPLGRSRRAAFKKVRSFYGFRDTVKLAVISVLLRFGGFFVGFLSGGEGADYTLRQVLKREKICTLRLGNINSEESVAELKKLRPDIIVSISASQRFGAAVLKLPPLGCLNVHSGELPRYRGMLTVFWQLYEGRDYTVPTVHLMNEELDAGPIVAKSRCRLEKDDSLYRATVKTKICAARLAAEVLEKFASGEVATTPNDPTFAKAFPFPGRAEAEELRRAGRQLV